MLRTSPTGERLDPGCPNGERYAHGAGPHGHPVPTVVQTASGVREARDGILSPSRRDDTSSSRGRRRVYRSRCTAFRGSASTRRVAAFSALGHGIIDDVEMWARRAGRAYPPQQRRGRHGRTVCLGPIDYALDEVTRVLRRSFDQAPRFGVATSSGPIGQSKKLGKRGKGGIGARRRTLVHLDLRRRRHGLRSGSASSARASSSTRRAGVASRLRRSITKLWNGSSTNK